MVLDISASDPLRRTIATFGLAVRPNVFSMPRASMRADAKTNTTRARPKAAAAVVCLRTMRFLTLYLIGIMVNPPAEVHRSRRRALPGRWEAARRARRARAR